MERTRQSVQDVALHRASLYPRPHSSTARPNCTAHGTSGCRRGPVRHQLLQALRDHSSLYLGAEITKLSQIRAEVSTDVGGKCSPVAQGAWKRTRAE